MYPHLYATIFGLTTGNFLAQLMFVAVPDFGIATERSFFQILAVVVFAMMLKTNNLIKE